MIQNKTITISTRISEEDAKKAKKLIEKKYKIRISDFLRNVIKKEIEKKNDEV